MPIINFLACNDNLCEECRIQNLDCAACLGFKMISFGKNAGEKTILNPIYQCVNCSNHIELSRNKKYYKCNQCKIKFCSICKDKYHRKNYCIEISKEIFIMCSCNNECVRRSNQLFYECESENLIYKCSVCFQNLNTSHMKCSRLLQR